MTRVYLLFAVSLAIVAAFTSPALSRPRHDAAITEFGSVCGPPDCPYGSNRVAADMGVNLVRLRVDSASPPTLQQLRDAASAGHDVQINMPDNCTGTILPDALWQAKIAADLDAAIATRAHIVLVVAGNEWDLETGCDGATYLANLTEFATIVHASGLRAVADGGISSGGVNAYYRNLVDHESPRNPRQVNKIKAFVERVSSTGIDYVNVHWYEGPKTFSTVVGWYADRVAKPLTNNEWGVYVLDGAYVTGTARAMQAMGMAHAIAFVRWGPPGQAVGFFDPKRTALNANGQAYETYNDGHPYIPRTRVLQTTSP